MADASNRGGAFKLLGFSAAAVLALREESEIAGRLNSRDVACIEDLCQMLRATFLSRWKFLDERIQEQYQLMADDAARRRPTRRCWSNKTVTWSVMATTTIWGASGYGRVVLDAVRARGAATVVEFIDDDESLEGKTFAGDPVLGRRNALADLLSRGVDRIHECVIDDGVHLAPGARVAGSDRVGAANFVGTGATILNCLEIAVRTIVGAGAVIVGDLPSGVVACGV